ncbi:MAG: hypothetical protein IKG74_02030 [Firmicutes bacterium]|nr:hypothetical protein [Bacillota bacterium]
MDDIYTQPLIEMGVALTELAVKGTASSINKRIRAIKDVKEADKLRTTYDALINEVLQEREEAVRIAQAYKAELDRISISDDDIQHLHNTISRLLDLLKQFSPNTSVESLETFKDLINADTLKTMQLLGFNYKAAIGEPLTNLCANAINNIGTKKPANQSKKH